MGRQKEQEEEEEESDQDKKQHSNSLTNKAAHFVSDITTVLLNPLSDQPSNHKHDDLSNSQHSQPDSNEGSGNSIDGPDTSSFSAFLYSFLSPSKSQNNTDLDGNIDSNDEDFKPLPEQLTKENVKKKSIFSRGKQSIGKAFYQAAKYGGFQKQSHMAVGTVSNSRASDDEGIAMETLNRPSLPLRNLPETSESSWLLSEKTRSVLYNALPVIVQDRKWVLLYSTWRHGISLSTLYRRSMLLPGLSLLVVGDRKGAVFGGLVEAPLRPTDHRRYQGTSNSFVFTNVSGNQIIYRPTGINRYFTLCSSDYLALGGGGHFALYLDGDLLSGSSSSSETYGNPCLARSEDFHIKEIELWSFVYASKYEEMMSSLQTEAPGICRWYK